MKRAAILFSALAGLLLATLAAAQTQPSDYPRPQQPSPEQTPPQQSHPDRDDRDRHHDHGGVGVGVTVDLGTLFGGGGKPTDDGGGDENVYVGKPDYVAHDPERTEGTLGRAVAHEAVVIERNREEFLRQYYYILTPHGPRWYWYDEPVDDDDVLGPLTDIPECGGHTDNCGNNTGDTPILADKKPTAIPGDPEGGITVPGGKVHRGTGEYVNPNNPNDKRAAFYLWVDFTAGDDCKACAWYQFLKIEVSLDGKDVTKAAAAGGSVPSSIGGRTTPGKWGGDWHKKDEEKEKKKKPHVKMPGEKPAVDGGAYAPRPIPGVDGAEGLVDAPNWGNTGGLSQILGRLPLHKKATGSQPPDEEHTIVITSHFRDYLYCIDPVKCLGYSEETYVETIKIKITWVAGDVELGTETAWKAVPSVVSDNSTVSFDGKWKNCP